MGRRYYCDYCDKSFVHTVEAVKKHTGSAHHRKLRHEHYARFRADFRPTLGALPAEDGRTAIENWLADRKRRGLTNSEPLENEFIARSAAKSGSVDSESSMAWNYPNVLSNVPTIPPSLNKISLKDFVDSDFAEWG